MSKKSPHRNRERVVKCPVEGCDAEKLARGLHLHVLRSVGDGHGPQGEVPDHIDFENLEEVGTEEVTVRYPEERAVESVARLCPYCGKAFKGKNGVLIHLGQVAGRKNHPENASAIHEASDFPAVTLDEDDNVVAVVEGDTTQSPSTEPHERTVPAERVYRYIADLIAEGKRDEAGIARDRLLINE